MSFEYIRAFYFVNYPFVTKKLRAELLCDRQNLFAIIFRIDSQAWLDEVWWCCSFYSEPNPNHH